MRQSHQVLRNRLIHDDRPMSRARRFLVAAFGMALATPLLAQSMPFLRHLSWLFLPLALWGFALVFFHPELRPTKPDLLVSLLLANLFFFALGMLLTKELLPAAVWKDLARGSYAVLLAAVVMALTRTRAQASSLLRWFTGSAAAVAVAAAAFGTVKCCLLLCGFELPFLAQCTPPIYPWGTSLACDYNFFGLSLLIGGLALLYYWRTANTGHAALLWALLLGLVIVVGAYAGSKRFWLATPVVFVAQLQRYRYCSYSAMHRPRWVALATGVACAAVVLSSTFLGLTAHTLQARGDTQHPLEKVKIEQIQIMIESYQARARSMVTSKDMFNASARLDRWLFAVELSRQRRTAWLGGGFDYQRAFSCKFVDCALADYPHNPVLSALLYGGIVACGICALLILCTVSWAVRALRNTHQSTLAGLILLVTLLFVVVSSDTIFSTPVFSAVATLVRVASSRLRDGIIENVSTIG